MATEYKTTVTTKAKKKMLLARAGASAIPKIVGMVFGDGGVNSSGVVMPHSADSNTLRHELLRKNVDGYTIVSDSVVRYTCTLGKDELAGKNISEIGLYDAAGDIVAMKAFSSKGKDAGIEMIYECDDTF